MTIDEARNVMWVRPNREPIGKLLDKGYLTQDRLRWAAENAYSAQLREAATLILEELSKSQDQTAEKPQPSSETQSSPLPPVDIPMTVAEAERTTWPFSVFKGQQIGSLVKTKQLTLKDLLFAIQNAWDLRVKQAATILMLQQLNQAINEPIPSAGKLRVFSGGRSYAEFKQFQIVLIQGMLIGSAIMGFLVFSFGFLLPKITIVLPKLTVSVLTPIFEALNVAAMNLSRSVLKVIVFVAAVLIGLVMLATTFWIFTLSMNALLSRLGEKLLSYRKGQEGENSIFETMLTTLDGDWSLFRNVVLPGKKTDLDLILVGPPGIWTLEVKNFSGEYRNTTEHWEYRAGNRWKVMKKNPTRQAQHNARQLFALLKRYGVKRVEPIVVWANPESPITTTNAAVPVWKYTQLPEELGNIWQNQTISKSDQERIENALHEMCKN
jgi:hypothetical protein